MKAGLTITIGYTAYGDTVGEDSTGEEGESVDSAGENNEGEDSAGRDPTSKNTAYEDIVDEDSVVRILQVKKIAGEDGAMGQCIWGWYAAGEDSTGKNSEVK
jgi:hypothetical protein